MFSLDICDERVIVAEGNGEDFNKNGNPLMWVSLELTKVNKYKHFCKRERERVDQLFHVIVSLIVRNRISYLEVKRMKVIK